MTQYLFLLALIGLAGCSPKIYLIDRQTVLEEEAAGEWPDFEQEILKQSIQQGPTPFSKTSETHHEKRLFQVLNGEHVSKYTEKAKEKSE